MGWEHGMLPLQTELRVVGDAASTAVCEVSRGAFFAPRPPPPRIVGMGGHHPWL